MGLECVSGCWHRRAGTESSQGGSCQVRVKVRIRVTVRVPVKSRDRVSFRLKVRSRLGSGLQLGGQKLGSGSGLELGAQRCSHLNG